MQSGRGSPLAADGERSAAKNPDLTSVGSTEPYSQEITAPSATEQDALVAAFLVTPAASPPHREVQRHQSDGGSRSFPERRGLVYGPVLLEPPSMEAISSTV